MMFQRFELFLGKKQRVNRIRSRFSSAYGVRSPKKIFRLPLKIHKIRQKIKPDTLCIGFYFPTLIFLHFSLLAMSIIVKTADFKIEQSVHFKIG